jgi:thiol-disulfide isomerase/thioredoxin
MKSLLIMVALASLVAPAVATQDKKTDRQAGAPAANAMPQMNLQDLDGKAIETDKLKGSILVVDFWATWCGPCIKEIPAYNKLQEKYADKGVKFIGVTMASGEAKEVKSFVAERKLKYTEMKYTVLMGDDTQAYDFNIIGFPTTYLVTRDWKIYRKYIGAGPRKTEQLEIDIQKLLETEKP